VLILDEPTSGLDPLNQETVYAFVRAAREEGRTVFFSSHILSEVEGLCDRVGFIREGRLVQVGPVHALVGMRSYEVVAECAAPPPAGLLDGVAGVSQGRIEGTTVRCTVQGEMNGLLAALLPYHVRRLLSHEPSLSELFMQLYEGEGAPPAPAGSAGRTPTVVK